MQKPSPKLIGLVAVAAVLTGGLWLHGQGIESTDDAFIAGRVVTLAPKVPGYVTDLKVSDNQPVKAGDVLAIIDPTDYQSKRDSLQAQLEAAQAEETQANADLERVKAQSSLSASAQTRQLADTKVKVAAASVATLKAQLASAENDLAGTRLIAPMDGTVAKRAIEVGSHVDAGQAALAVVGTARWIVANFKETQLTDMRPGQKVEIEVDAYPSLRLTGTVDSLQGGTGASFSTFPPENATGNFVKVVQRVPVKITIEGELPADIPLAIGLSVVPTVYTR